MLDMIGPCGRRAAAWKVRPFHANISRSAIRTGLGRRNIGSRELWRRVADRMVLPLSAIGRSHLGNTGEYWPDRECEVMFIGDSSEYLRNGYRNIDARTLWHYSATVVAPALVSTVEGVGSAYLTDFRDSDGAYLDSSKTYRLRVSANAP